MDYKTTNKNSTTTNNRKMVNEGDVTEKDVIEVRDTLFGNILRTYAKTSWACVGNLVRLGRMILWSIR